MEILRSFQTRSMERSPGATPSGLRLNEFLGDPAVQQRILTSQLGGKTRQDEIKTPGA